jgi:hypothetical protein
VVEQAPGTAGFSHGGFWERLPLREYSEVESRRHMELLGSADVVDAAVAFMEKRPPLFRGV